MNLPNKPKVLAATYNPVSNTKMISFLVDFPTVLLAELRTHRIISDLDNEPLYAYNSKELNDFNLSANSARAIPHKAYLQKVLDNPFVPIWTKQQKGMSGELIEGIQKDIADGIWSNSYYDGKANISNTLQNYKQLIESGVHKQNANRLLAPFAYTTCIISGTEWDSFFSLRCPQYHSLDGMIYNSKKECMYFNRLYTGVHNLQEPDWTQNNTSSAQPEFQVIAEMLYDLYQEADWKESKYHIPFEDEITRLYYTNITNFLDNHTKENRENEGNNLYMKISASMCAKLSYNTQDNEDTLEKHLERANMLIESKHQEPFSHQAVAMDEDEFQMFHKSLIKKGYQEIEYGWCYNLRGFISQRYILENY